MRHEEYMKMKEKEEGMSSLQSMSIAAWATDEEELMDNYYSKQMELFDHTSRGDMVNSPPHYNQAGIECIDAIRAATDVGYEYYLQGNIIKYLWRYRYKNGVEDLEKAQWYLEKLIAYLNDLKLEGHDIEATTNIAELFKDKKNEEWKRK